MVTHSCFNLNLFITFWGFVYSECVSCVKYLFISFDYLSSEVPIVPFMIYIKLPQVSGYMFLAVSLFQLFP